MKNKITFPGGLRNLTKKPSFPAFLILVTLLIVNAVLQPNFFSYRALKSNFISFTPLVLAAIAQGIIILSGSLDLSLGSAISLFNVFVAYYMTDDNVFLMLVLGFFLTVVISGVINGLFIGRLKLPALITTFATSAIYLGLAMIILPVAGGYVPKFFYQFYKGSLLRAIPWAAVIMITGILIWYVFSKTRAYRYIYASGSSEEGAYASGINVWKTRLTAHIFASLFIFIAGVCVLMMTSTGEYRTGQSYTLNSVAAVVIGGIALSGGKGSIVGAIFGALALGILNNIIFYSGASSYLQILAKGAIIVLALVLSAVPILIREKRAAV
ncbi:MAG: ABC transporter permease [Spirochaetia bacterium]